MRVLVAAFLVAAVIAGAGCGDDGGGGDDGGVVIDDPTPSQAPARADDGCSESYPHGQDPPPNYAGYVVICDDGSGVDAQKISIENISDTAVITATPIEQAWTTADISSAPKPRFAQAQVQLRVLSICGQQTCVLPPGTTLQIAADRPVRASLGTRKIATMAAAVAYTGLDRLNAKLGTPGQRLLNQAAACYQAVAGLGVTEGPYEQQFRQLLGVDRCRSLYQQIAQEGAERPPGEPAAVEGLVSRAKKLLGASFNDVMVFVLKIAPR